MESISEDTHDTLDYQHDYPSKPRHFLYSYNHYKRAPFQEERYHLLHLSELFYSYHDDQV